MKYFNVVKYISTRSCSSSFHTSANRFSQIKQSQKKLMRRSVKVARIWKGMTVWDLAITTRQNLDYLTKVIKPSLANHIDGNGVIKNIFFVEKFLNREGISFKRVCNNVAKSTMTEKAKIPELPTSVVPDKKGNEVKRPPVVTIMGHVDHGKTTLLDALRSSNIVASEAGGITQHIGAFSVSVSPKDTITFIDTPGHAAFRKMRNQGAEVTDIVVLIIAADDGVMEQTVESIKMAQNAGAKIIVAVNKIDKAPENNVSAIKEQLLSYNIQSEDLGGDVQVVGISALKKINLDKLTEAILLEAEVMDLKSDPNGPFEGVVIESFTDKGGKFATVLVKRGTLRKRAVLLAGTAMGKVRLIINEKGDMLSEATLSQPVRVGNWDVVPNSGEKVIQVRSEKEANSFIKAKKKEELERRNVEDFHIMQEKAVQAKAENTERKRTYLALKKANNYLELKKFLSAKPNNVVKEELEYDVIIKGDTKGSVDAILDVLSTYNCEKYCRLNVASYGVGNVTENDIKIAETFNATIYCFNIDFPQEHKEVIVEKNIKIKLHNIIYKLLDDLKQEISAILPLLEKEVVKGTGEVLEHFSVTENGKKVPVGGCICLSGEFAKNLFFKLERDDKVIHAGEIKHLKHFKNYVNVIKKDQQCGIMFKNFIGEFKTGDKVVCFQKVLVPQILPWETGF